MIQAAPGSFGQSVAALTTVRLLGMAAGFAVSVIGARALDQTEFGAAGVAIAIGTVAALLCNGGVNIATIYLAGRSPDQRGEIFRATSAIALTGILLSWLVVAAASIGLGEVLKLGGRGELFAAAGVVAAGVIGFEYGGSLLLAVSRPAAYAAVDLGRSLATLALTVGAMALAATDASFVVATGLAYLFGASAAISAANRASGSVGIGWQPRLMRASLGLGLRGQVGNVLQFLNLRLDLLLIPALLALPAAGIYLVAVRVAEALAQVASAAGSLIFPAVAATDDPRSTALTERTMRTTLVVVAISALAVIAIADPLVAVVFGSEYAGSTTSLRILAVAMVPLAVSRILAGDLKGRGRPGIVSLAMLAAVAVTLALDLLLIPALGIAGAALASLLAYGVAAALLLAAYRAATGSRLAVLVPGRADAAAMVRAARLRRDTPP